MAQAAPVAGFFAKLRAHDLRHGAAQDTTNIGAAIKGYATSTVAAILGHSKNTHQKGVTAGYVGDIREAVYTKRVEDNFKDRFVKRRKVAPSTITEICEKERLDPLGCEG